MNFDPALLKTYRALLQTTDLQKAYQEFIRLFRFLFYVCRKRCYGQIR